MLSLMIRLSYIKITLSKQVAPPFEETLPKTICEPYLKFLSVVLEEKIFKSSCYQKPLYFGTNLALKKHLYM